MAFVAFLALFITSKKEEYIIAKGGEKFNIDFKNRIYNKKMQLTIYYTQVDAANPLPLANDFVKRNYEYKIIVSSFILRDYLEQLQSIENIEFQKPIDYDYLNIVIYCDFHEDDKKIFSFSLSSDSRNMLVNNLVVKNEKIFYYLIIPFLPKDVADYYAEFLDKKITF